MSKEQPNELQRVVRSFLRDLIVSTHQPKLKKTEENRSSISPFNEKRTYSKT